MTDDIKEILRDIAALETNGEYEKEFDLISEAMRKDPENYELFYMLGRWYFFRNADMAYICFEQALFYLKKLSSFPINDLRMIQKDIDELLLGNSLSVSDVSIVIVSYNDIEIMKENLKAIRNYTDAAHTEVVVVDNASADGVAEWLEEQKDILFIEASKNYGFPIACNIGAAAATAGNDLFFLNNDAVLTPNALFFLRMALYSSHDTGMVSGISNNVMTQTVEVRDKSLKGCIRFGRENNVPMRNALEIRQRLTGFALLIKFQALNEAITEMRFTDMNVDRDIIFDERFSPAYFEDDDLGLRVSQAGYREYLVHNAFIYHKGGDGFDSENKTMIKSRETFTEKWGFDMWGYELYSDDLIAALEKKEKDHNRAIRVLELFSGLGANLSRIKWLYPNSWTAGIEISPLLAGIARFSADRIISDNIFSELKNGRKKTFPLAERSFDYIIIDFDSFDEDMASYLRKSLENYLSEKGEFLSF